MDRSIVVLLMLALLFMMLFSCTHRSRISLGFISCSFFVLRDVGSYGSAVVPEAIAFVLVLSLSLCFCTAMLILLMI